MDEPGLSTAGAVVQHRVTATPDGSPIDAVVGASDGIADAFTDLAAIVRFNPDGMIDVRAGDIYQASATVPYSAGVAYRFHLDISLGEHVYSVRVNSGNGWIQLAASYPFRVEQNQVGALGNLGSKIDSDTGGVEVCDIGILPASIAGCDMADAGLGFQHQSIGQPGEVIASWEFLATPDSILDGVIGLSQSTAQSFGDLDV